jgi:Uri superfamily endonuclease
MNYGEEIGIYLISTKYVRHGLLIEKYIYVGETINSFETRCDQHLGSETKDASKWVGRIGTWN